MGVSSQTKTRVTKTFFLKHYLLFSWPYPAPHSGTLPSLSPLKQSKLNLIVESSSVCGSMGFSWLISNVRFDLIKWMSHLVWKTHFIWLLLLCKSSLSNRTCAQLRPLWLSNQGIILLLLGQIPWCLCMNLFYLLFYLQIYSMTPQINALTWANELHWLRSNSFLDGHSWSFWL